MRIMHINWEKYINKTLSSTPRELLVEALSYVEQKDDALDLGAGALMDSKYLIDQGFKHVTAIDADPAFVEHAKNIESPQFSFQHIPLQDFTFQKESYDLINAQLVLPYLSKSDFDQTIKNIFNALRQGGIFTGMFFGERDEQILPPGVTMTRVTINELKSIFSEYKIEKCIETEEDKNSALGVLKHFHKIGIIAKKLR